MNPSMTDETWIDLFTLELRVRRVPGAVIGDAVASVRELLADSGESAEAAFGPAREYAAALELPAAEPRQRGLRAVFLPVLGLFSLLVFALAANAWSAGETVLLTGVQVALLVVPVLLTVVFSFPLHPRSVSGRRWLPVVLILVGGVVGALAALFAPSTAADAWLVLSALPVMVGAMVVLVILSVIGTVATARDGDSHVITDPRRAQGEARPRQVPRSFLLAVNWIFPVLAVLILATAWAVSVRH